MAPRIIFWLSVLVILGGQGLAAPPAQALTPIPNEETQTHLFHDLDKDRDGVVSLKDYQDSHQACMRDPKCRAWLENKFYDLDMNRDGFLTLDEFLAPLRQKAKGKP
jgi:Ca2+-binding EF-hand superfamily protein